MARYDDCVIFSETMEFPSFRPIPWLAKLDDQPVFQCSYSIHWNMPFDPETQPKSAPGQRIVGHPPHMHKENEILFLLSGDPNDPYELGAEVELCFGPEMEKHVITRSACLRIPGGLPHGFYHVNSCTRPWLFIEVQEANPKTEKFLWDYLTPEELQSIPEAQMKNLWVDVGFD